MLTTDDVLGVVNGLDRPGKNAGRIRALRMANKRGMRSDLTDSQRRFLDAAAATPGPDRPAKYVHPGTTAMITRPNRGNTPLSDSELEWLRRLPADPSKIAFTDAQRLLGLAASVTKPDDRTLVRSIAAPVREYHDQQQAKLDVDNASTAPIPAPVETLPALADAVTAENDQLEPHEALARASELLRANAQQRSAERGWKQGDAQDRLDKLSHAATARTAVHR